MSPGSPGVAGVLLAAGAGRRMGRPKALVDDWLARGLRTLGDGGAAPLIVVLGAEAEQARGLLRAESDPPAHEIVVAEHWASGMGASLAAALDHLAARAAAGEVDAVAVHLVDLPDVDGAVLRRVLDAVPHDAAQRRAWLGRAAYAGVPGHPVVLGADHLVALRARLDGDAGARDYLRERSPVLVECGDLAGGEDVDRLG